MWGLNDLNKTFWRFRIKNNMSISTGKLDCKGPKMNLPWNPDTLKRSHYLYKILRSQPSLIRKPASITPTAVQNGYLDVCGGWWQRTLLVTSLGRLKVTNSMMLLNQCSRPESGPSVVSQTSKSFKQLQNRVSHLKHNFLKPC